MVALPCNWTVRAWYYPATGKDRTPRMLPAQYWPYEFAATSQDGANPYTTSFAKGLKGDRAAGVRRSLRAEVRTPDIRDRHQTRSVERTDRVF